MTHLKKRKKLHKIIHMKYVSKEHCLRGFNKRKPTLEHVTANVLAVSLVSPPASVSLWLSFLSPTLPLSSPKHAELPPCRQQTKTEHESDLQVQTHL